MSKRVRKKCITCNVKYRLKYRKYCEECIKIHYGEKKFIERERDNKQHRVKYASNIDTHKNYSLKTKYGMTLEEFKELLLSQNNVCAICNLPETKLYRHLDNQELRQLSVDHNHITGKVRGLLCHNCNTAIGLLKENTAILKSAIEYLSINETI